MELLALARNPVPSGAVVGTFAGYDKLALRYARWAETRSPRRGTVVIFPGRGEPIEKYFETIADLRRRGFAVAMHDFRGQGGSPRLLPDPGKGHIVDFAQYDADIVRFMRDIVLPDCPPPYIALGHSMGGNIALRNAVIAGSWFDRMVLTAPMLAFANRKVGAPQVLARAYAEALGISRLGRNYIWGGSAAPEEAIRFEDNVLTSDADRFSRNRQIFEMAPQLAIGSPTIAWVRAAYRSMRLVMTPEFATRVRVPLLLVAAGQDQIVSSPAVEIFAGRLKLGMRIVLNHSRHEILQERDDVRQQFWAAFDAWLGINKAQAA
jgi:lysophospholipase